MSSELGAWKQKSDLTSLYCLRDVDANTAHCTCRMTIKAKSDFCLRAHNSDDMDFFSEFFSPGPQVGNNEANGKVLSKNSDSKLSKK